MTQREKILLINPKDSYTLGSPPLGIGYLLSYSNKINQNDVFFLDENFTNTDLLETSLDKAVVSLNPSFVGITFPSSAIKRVVTIVKHLKENFPNIILFAGGYHPTSEPEYTLKLIPGFDFLVLGQSEYTFAHMGQNWRTLPGVAYFSEKLFIQNEISNPIKSLNEIPYIDRTIFDPKYFEPNYVIPGIFGKTATIMTSRGCPFSCFFCSNKLLQKKVSFHSIDYVIGEIETILTQVGKLDYFFFLDVMFLTNWHRTHELCLALIKSKILKGIKWAATVSANVITEEKVHLMKEAGCFLLCFGLESNSNHSLKLMNKKARAHHNETALEVCKKLGVYANSAFLFGIPGEVEEDLDETLNFIRKYNVFATGINVMKPLPGSPFYDQLVNQGLIDRSIEDWYKVSSIHHASEYYNDNISNNTYKDYTNKFNNIVHNKQRINHLRANLKKIIKYRLLSSLQE